MTRRAAVLLALLVSSSLVVEAAKIQVQVHPTFDFARLATWAWHPTGPGTVKIWVSKDSDPEPVKRQYEPVLMQAVEQNFASRGYTLASAGVPDFLVTYRLLVTLGQSSQHMGQFLPTNANWGIPPFAPQTQSLSMYPQGTLVLDVESPAEGTLIWRGIVEAKIETENTEEKRAARLRGVIKDLIGKFPKKKKG